MGVKDNIATGGAMSGVPVTVATGGVIDEVGDAVASTPSDLVSNMISDLTMILTELGCNILVQRKTDTWSGGRVTSTSWSYVYRSVSGVWQPVDGKTVIQERGMTIKSVAMVQVAKTTDIEENDKVKKVGGSDEFRVNYVKEFITHKTVYLTRAGGMR